MAKKPEPIESVRDLYERPKNPAPEACEDYPPRSARRLHQGPTKEERPPPALQLSILMGVSEITRNPLLYDPRSLIARE